MRRPRERRDGPKDLRPRTPGARRTSASGWRKRTRLRGIGRGSFVAVSDVDVVVLLLVLVAVSRGRVEEKIFLLPSGCEAF